jgi:hypothetical protein
MASTSHTFTDERLRSYLLGLAPESDSEALDEASVADDAVAARLAVLEDDLYDDYARGVLKAPERARFQERYLASAAGRGRLEFARALGSRPPAVTPAPTTTAAFRWWSVAAALLAVGILGLIYLVDDRPQVTDNTVRPPITTPAPATPAVVAVFTLMPTAARSATESTPLIVPGDVTSITLRLVGLPETQPLTSPEVVVRTVGGREVFRGPARPVDGSADGVRAEVGLPAALLLPDDYLVQLNESRPERAEERVRYFLRVRNR